MDQSRPSLQIRIEMLTPVAAVILDHDAHTINQIVYGRYLYPLDDFIEIITEDKKLLSVDHIKPLTEEQYIAHLERSKP